MDNAENRAQRLPQIGSVSLQSWIDNRDVVIRCHVYAGLRRAGLPSDQADKLAREALAKAQKDIGEDLPDATKADLRTLRIRRST